MCRTVEVEHVRNLHGPAERLRACALDKPLSVPAIRWPIEVSNVPWAQIDDLFADHPKVRALSDAAFRVHVAAICYCNRHLTDGHLVGHDQAGLTRLTTAELAAAVTELVTAEVWHRTEAGYYLHDFLDWNPTRERRLAEKAASRNRKEKERLSRQESRRDSRRKGGVTPPGVSDPSPSPSPSPKTESETALRSARRDAPKAPPPPDATPFVAFVLSTWPDVRTVPETAWRDACPALDLLAEARKAHAWELSQPASRRKRDHRRFLDGWLRRAQERAATAPLTRQPPLRATSPAATKEDFDGGPRTL